MAAPQHHRGFTLLEVIIVVALGVLLVALTLPVGVSYYRSQAADETGAQLLSVFSRAASESRLGKDNGAFGVKFFPDRYVYFGGDSYASRNTARDETYLLPTGVTLSSPFDEFVFAKLTGIPNATGTILLSQFERTLSITVDDLGMIIKN